jgi:hypothetical protein
MTTNSSETDVGELSHDDTTLAILKAIEESSLDALLMHKRLGLPVAEWRDGKVVWVPAENIVLPPDVSG